MRDWTYISMNISAKEYDCFLHIRKLNLETGKYSYMKLFRWELEDILKKVENVLQEDADEV